ncbi:SMP-30/gluconolactonase/LRE family protein [Microbacterium sp. AR7-10]|uniref:SMP-30/gluconolactonase/LRE family protein n=1 Tax=Microbacterium sp. AR7-10 TaxID=1891970 RepID=UPI0008FCCBF3|nr:SMP-30/gluconolactonase/LRE family protein [Microbacterium sp. AR7-10]OIU88213.1 calcium-binding protein [Microbacterium sp. AR7-10]
MEIDILVDVKTELGEGPLWDPELERLFWIDSKGGKVFRSTADGTELRAWDTPGLIGSMALRRDGDGAIVALENGLHTLDFATGDTEFLHDPEPVLSQNRLNDGKVDARGRFVFGSMNKNEEGPTAALYSLDTDFSVRTLDDELIVSNGPCWSPDGSTFYFSDTWSGEIWAYDYDLETGDASNRRKFGDVDTSRGGGADGSTVDAEGYLWNALVYDGKLVRYAPDGTVDRIIDMPVKKVTSVMFGGANLDVLYVTSMSKPPLPRFPDDPVQRGSVFAVTGLGIQGLPEHRFGA